MTQVLIYDKSWSMTDVVTGNGKLLLARLLTSKTVIISIRTACQGETHASYSRIWDGNPLNWHIPRSNTIRRSHIYVDHSSAFIRGTDGDV